MFLTSSDQHALITFPTSYCGTGSSWGCWEGVKGQKWGLESYAYCAYTLSRSPLPPICKEDLPKDSRQELSGMSYAF